MTDVESLARRICFQVGGFDPDEIMANDGPRWRYYIPTANVCFAWLREHEERLGYGLKASVAMEEK